MARHGKTKEELEETQVRFTKENASEMAKRRWEKARTSITTLLTDHIGNERAVTALGKAIDKGDIRGIELYFKLTGQISDKLEIKQTSVSAEFVKKFLDKFHAKE